MTVEVATDSSTAAVGAIAPTRIRYAVLAFLCALAFVLYLDRICISQAVQPIQTELGLTNQQMSFVLAAFTLAYGLFEIPTGHWGDKLGSRRVLTRISIWWSVFTALTAACSGFYSLVVVRFLFGAGEAGAYPNAARIIARWFPPGERGRAQGLLQTVALCGGASAPVLAAYLIRTIGWRMTFVAFGSLGVFWAVAFYHWFRDEPAEHPGVNRAELDKIGDTSASASTRHASIPWRVVLTSPGIWLLATIMTCAACNSYVYFSWFPKYLQAGRQLNLTTAGWLASLVLASAAVGTLSGGFVTDAIQRYFTRVMWCRRLWGFTAFFSAAVLLRVAVNCESPYATAILAAASCLAMNLTLANWWSCAIEISGRHVGALFGLMNGLGVFGAMASQFLFGFYADWQAARGITGREQWDPSFRVVSYVLLTAAVCWLCMFISRPVDSPAPSDA